MSASEHTTAERVACFHCGDDCGPQPVIWDDKPFCCTGCRSIYQILHENELSGFYRLESPDGTRPKQQAFDTEAFAYLDDPELQARLHQFLAPTQARITFHIPQIHCISCVWLLEHLHRVAEGVIESRVQFARREVSIRYDPSRLSLRKLVEQLAALGYTPELNLARLDETDRRYSLPRRLLYQLGVTGFCFGNIMLLSFPDYLAGGNLEPLYRQVFAWVSLGLSLPVVFYGAADYFRQAISGLRHGLVKIDVPLALGIVMMFLRSLYDIFWMGGTGFLDSLAGLVFFLLLGKVFQQKVYTSLSFDRDYRAYFPLSVLRRDRSGTGIHTVAVNQLEVGDRILIRHGELVPADALLRQGEALMDYSFVTGESEPVSVESGAQIYAGGRQQGSRIEAEVLKPVDRSYLVQLWNQEAFRETEAATHSSVLDRISRVFTLVVLGMAGAGGTVWAFLDPAQAIPVATAVLIIACPCALALSVPFTYGYLVRIFGRHRLFLKNSLVLERLTGVDTVIFDKTGTLTESRTEASVRLEGQHQPLTSEEQAWVRAVAQHSAHPLSVQLVRSLPEQPTPPLAFFSETPGRGLVGRIGTHEIRLGSWAHVEESGEMNAYNPGTDPPQETEVRASRVYLAVDGRVRGLFRMSHRLRPGSESMLRALAPEYRLYLLSGDRDADRERLQPYFPEPGQMHFFQQPLDKLQFVQQLQARGQRPLMLGDGLNDAGALRQSHVGISVTEDAAQFTPASDAILDAQALPQLPALLQLARRSRRILRVCLGFSLAYNTAGLGAALVGWVTPLFAAILMPLSSISIVLLTALLTRYYERRELG